MSDLALGRRRQPSVSLRAGHLRTQSKVIPQPKSTHTSDDFLRDFLNPSFDPASYLNAALPPLSRRQPSAQAPHDAVALGDLSSQAQTIVNQLNTHTNRLSTTLTQLTDDILRSGSRLAYKVELLRGETLSLTEALNETLQEDVKVFLPNGLPQDGEDKKTSTALENGERKLDASETGLVKEEEPQQPQYLGAEDPDFIHKLQTLTTVRARLDSVIKTFGDAMEFVFPPSELSVGSGFLSVSAPEPGSAQQSSEQKGQQVLQNLRLEISNLLTKSADPVDGIAKAASRIEQLKELNTVWSGTAEENGRSKFIDSLAKMVEDRHGDLTKEMAAKREGSRPAGGTHSRKGSSVTGEDVAKGLGGFGLINQLQRLRTGLN